MRETAYAKLNLALHVRARRDDGYHDIETVFAFCEDGDELSVHGQGRVSVEIVGPFAGDLPPGDDNLVMRSARALHERLGVASGAKLTLDKRVPVASGIGGGSADAAAALRLLNRWWRLAAPEDALLAIAGRLGADVPACLLSRPTRGEGRGDRLTRLEEPGLAGTPVLLVNPRTPLSTAAVFARWDGNGGGELRDWRDGRNDLEPAAIELVPLIGAVLSAFERSDIARMSGSGATCFGLYADAAARDADAERIAARHPDWWLLRTRLR